MVPFSFAYNSFISLYNSFSSFLCRHCRLSCYPLLSLPSHILPSQILSSSPRLSNLVLIDFLLLVATLGYFLLPLDLLSPVAITLGNPHLAALEITVLFVHLLDLLTCRHLFKDESPPGCHRFEDRTSSERHRGPSRSSVQTPGLDLRLSSPLPVIGWTLQYE